MEIYKIYSILNQFYFSSQIVPYTGDDEDYNLALTGLSPGVPYELKIQTLDRNSYVLFTSQDVRSSSTCLPPTQPPSQLAIDAPDARHVRVTWVPVVQSAWKCSEAKVELQVCDFVFLTKNSDSFHNFPSL